MKKIVYFIAAIILLSACQETLEERCSREAKEFTEKNCPLRAANGIVMDSMSFDKKSHTISYYYIVSGVLDDSTILLGNNPRERLLTVIKNTTKLKLYQEAGYNFRYVYFSEKKKGTQLFEATFRESDYK